MHRICTVSEVTAEHMCVYTYCVLMGWLCVVVRLFDIILCVMCWCVAVV